MKKGIALIALVASIGILGGCRHKKKKHHKHKNHHHKKMKHKK